MNFRKKGFWIAVLLIALLLITGFGIFEVELNTKKPLIDLDLAVEHYKIGKPGNLSSGSAIEAASEAAEEETGITIRVRNRAIFLNDTVVADITALKTKLAGEDPDKTVLLVDAYAESSTYKAVLSVLEENRIPFEQEQED